MIKKPFGAVSQPAGAGTPPPLPVGLHDCRVSLWANKTKPLLSPEEGIYRNPYYTLRCDTYGC